MGQGERIGTAEIGRPRTRTSTLPCDYARPSAHAHMCPASCPQRSACTLTYLPTLTRVCLHPHARGSPCHPKLTHPPTLTCTHFHCSLRSSGANTQSAPPFDTHALVTQPARVSIYSPSARPCLTYHPHSLSFSISLCTTEKAGWLERQRYLWDYVIWSSNSRGIQTTGGNMAWPWEGGCSGMGRGSLEHEICGVSAKNQET